MVYEGQRKIPIAYASEILYLLYCLSLLADGALYVMQLKAFREQL